MVLKMETETEKLNLVAGYASGWERMMEEWNSDDGRENSCRLAFSASYLFLTDGVRWVLDPVSLLHRMSRPHGTDFAADFRSLAFGLISHLHIDHFDRILLSALAENDAKWIIPEMLLPDFRRQAGLPEKRLIPIRIGECVRLNGIAVTAFEGYHGIPGADIPAAAFLVETDRLRLWFPGDVRDYSRDLPAGLGRPDVTLAHVWLGYQAAQIGYEQMLEPFRRFHAAANPHRILLTHLRETARDDDSYWTTRHVRRLTAEFKRSDPGIRVEAANPLDKVRL